MQLAIRKNAVGNKYNNYSNNCNTAYGPRYNHLLDIPNP